MVKLEDVADTLLSQPSNSAHTVQTRPASTYKPLSTYKLDKGRSYQQQYGDMYFLRLTKIRPAVEEVAEAEWSGTVVAGEEAKRVDRVLDVKQGELCWVVGTIFMAMPLKPDILEDVSKDRWISAPVVPEKYFSNPEENEIMLEDDSGRIRLAGDLLKTVDLVTGCIIAVMGTENTNGDLEIVDIQLPNLPPQPERWKLTKPVKKDEDEEMADSSQGAGSKIAIVSGLSFSASDASHGLELNLLLEYLLGEALGPQGQSDVSQISRLIIAGDSIDAAQADEQPEKKGAKKYGYDASAYNALPSQLFDEFLSELLPTIPVTLMPGAQDPANASYPQQPIHAAMFPTARAYAQVPGSKEPGWFDTTTNPWEAEVDGWRMLGTGGQNVDDVFKYVESDDRLSMMEAMCRWRCVAPTAPDTLWSYPFQDDDPFVIKTCPHLYFVGNQPEFGTRVIHGPDDQSVRLITVPSFAQSKEIVIVDTETLDVSTVQIVAR
ncbi:DNA polymerase alpha/epsilon subunit B-domain-containing protein [Emericellopsis atlantica]|uniref:DNA-directed DNA polymerase n=1 Tax=Emericellopsis atlantica TaxID=2614577 RepID=A0A9P7ZP97_9HYPO|nr:DNA polymerase alpha/epsilon subunit B-domain-containing protein [Emericellopsis atlantica]KAG9255336.1 DNA polymerase alpha/epsilon subunit B-domain-containing protein [Emericellopsis atlantica]